jgi:hypothetical protein
MVSFEAFKCFIQESHDAKREDMFKVAKKTDLTLNEG